MFTTPWVKHTFSDKLRNTLPFCIKCNSEFHPNGRGLTGTIYTKDDRFMTITPDKFIECTMESNAS